MSTDFFDVMKFPLQGGGIIKFPKTKVSESIVDSILIEKNRLTCVIAPRQKLKTATICAILGYLAMYDDDFSFRVFARNKDIEKFLFNKIKDFIYYSINDADTYKKAYNRLYKDVKEAKYNYFEDFEFIKDIDIEIMSKFNNIITSSTINDDFDPDTYIKLMSKINNNKFIHIRPSDLNMTDEELERMKMDLINDEDIFRREVMVERK